MNNKDNAKLLNDLVEYLYDSRNGYKECADQVANPRLKDLFARLSTLRQSMIARLSQEVKNLGEEPVTSGSMIAAAHRTFFVDLKALLTGGDEQAITNEINRGENMMIDRYQEVLNKSELPSQISSLLREQLNEIRSNVSSVNMQTMNA